MNQTRDHLTILFRTFGDHVDGAPICVGALRADRPVLRHILERIRAYNAWCAKGNIGFLQEDIPDADPLALTYYPIRWTQRRPYYKEYQAARDGALFQMVVDPVMVEHMPPVPSGRHKIRLSLNSIGFLACQHQPVRLMDTDALSMETVYRVLAALTPDADLPALLREMAEEAPQAAADLLDGQIAFWAPGGKVLRPAPVLNPALLGALLRSSHRALRERALTSVPDVREASEAEYRRTRLRR